TLHARDLRTGAERPERIEKVGSVAWAADGSTFFYVVEDDAKRPHRLYRRRLGDPAGELLYEEADQLFRLGVWRSRSRALLFSASGSFTTSEVRYLRADRPRDAWRTIAPRERDHEYGVEHGRDRFWIRTNGPSRPGAGDRRNFRLVTAPLDDPSPARWTEVIAHRDDVMLEDTDLFERHVVVHERADGLVRLRILDLASGGDHHVAFPEPTYEVSADANAEFATPRYRLRYQSMITPASVFDYDMVERTLTLLKQTPVLGGYDPAEYRSERVHATAPDGTRVPISLVTRADMPRDGSSPMLLAGYGAYGIPYPVTFSSNRLSLLGRGLTVAIAHIRGGGEMGKRWHDAGRMLNKRNTFIDFIAAADFLVAARYTQREGLIIEGGSAGGLLIGAVINMRPDVSAGVILRVPFVDVVNTMLDESLPLTVGEFEEWGNPKIREHYEYLKTYCPYTNLAARPYPAILVRTSLNDSQVMYWEPAKYVARLRALLAPEHPLLFKIDMGAGHGGPSGRYDALRETAFDYAWLLGRLGRNA
ncbi:MAG: S9 family peptidase, partial [Candidatus Rokubacteria bacterium]|nr:S9 family peptidase [Candidatus Rokubacteria bacterium]